jgi:hypothetical protein
MTLNRHFGQEPGRGSGLLLQKTRALATNEGSGGEITPERAPVPASPLVSCRGIQAPSQEPTRLLCRLAA